METMSEDSHRLKFYKADVFTGQPFCGNPVAVLPNAESLSDRERQQIAREMNLSETVFVLPPTDPAAAARVRIFTPSQEIPFAGHPILGTFFVLGKLGRLPLSGPATHVRYECNIGVFPIEVYVKGGDIDRVVMAQPKPQFLGTVDSVAELYDVGKALGISKGLITETKCPVGIVSTGFPVLIVPIRTLTAVSSMAPDPSGVTEICHRFGVNGVMVFTTMTVEDSSSVHTRMFATPVGVMEDPATGSASGALGAYLVQNGIVEVAPTTEIIAEQGFELDRPSRILVQIVSDDDEIQEVKVGGQAVLVAEGTLMF